MEKKNRNKNSKNRFWDVPDAFRFMCLAQLHNSAEGCYCTGPIIRYLLDHMHDNDRWMLETSPYDVINMINTGMECLFPLELYNMAWTVFQKEIKQLLVRSDQLLRKYGPMDLQEGYRTSYENRGKLNLVALNQKFHMYFCVLFMYTENWDKLKDKLKILLDDTERNVQEMMSDEKLSRIAMQDSCKECHLPGADIWDPLTYLGEEMIPWGTARKKFTAVYEEYCLFLKKQREIWQSEVGSSLHLNAEKLLRELCALILDEVEDQLKYAENQEDADLLLAEKEQYERMYRESEERACQDVIPV